MNDEDILRLILNYLSDTSGVAATGGGSPPVAPAADAPYDPWSETAIGTLSGHPAFYDTSPSTVGYHVPTAQRMEMEQLLRVLQNALVQTQAHPNRNPGALSMQRTDDPAYVGPRAVGAPNPGLDTALANLQAGLIARQNALAPTQQPLALAYQPLDRAIYEGWANRPTALSAPMLRRPMEPLPWGPTTDQPVLLDTNRTAITRPPILGVGEQKASARPQQRSERRPMNRTPERAYQPPPRPVVDSRPTYQPSPQTRMMMSKSSPGGHFIG